MLGRVGPNAWRSADKLQFKELLPRRARPMPLAQRGLNPLSRKVGKQQESGWAL